MSNIIHPTAIVSSSVQLGDNVVIGPYAVVEGAVTLADNVEVGAHAILSGWTTVGKGTIIFPHAAVGSDPQDKKYKRGEKTFLEIGENNVFREFVTINRGTVEGGGVTRIGSNNLLMAYAHVAHDCTVGNDCVLANVTTLAGHVKVEDRVVIGGLSAVHQFVQVGKMSMVGGCSRVTQDVPPYSLCNGVPALIYGLNAVGLKRAGMPVSSLRILKQAFRIFFHSGLAKPTAIERIEKEIELVDEVRHLLEFARASERGMCASVKNGTETAE
ncbi:MAG: acyl-ACP--UDP-N-acetylglucosamine O-acyltransferase [Candidatus Omnitrophica bacterium]|nr:acyl-ACP--UDP-N-acetylglucosamine O-acyltransferase [Candidatus Omnitrophota bacterium]